MANRIDGQTLKNILSTNIKCLRSRREWSQVKLARELDISTNFLADIETGKSWVSVSTLVKLANILDVDVFELFKPEETAKDETQAIMTRLVQDISITLNQTLGNVSKQYLLP
ncbi:MAG: helix-turn-helix domain-containing protein [Treponema sp.]|jgi:transcriptional regulator with XRE-family HTH domain|nr:helix-turn-helix domain-containing protein [Treponema sp.]